MPIPSGPSAVIFCVVPNSPAPPAVSVSSYESKSSVSSLLHLALSSALSSVSDPPMWHFPPVPPSRVPPCGSSVFLCLLLASFAVVSVASSVPLVASALPRFSPSPSLVLPPASLPPPPLSLRLLCLPAPTRAPPSPAVNIACKDKDIGDQTGGGEARWLNVGGSAPRRKCPSSLLAVVGNGISRPLFLRHPQQ